MNEEVLTFLVENNEDVLYRITDYVKEQLETTDETLEEIVIEALKEVIQESFDLNYLEIYDILDEDKVYEEPFYSLYFKEELYIRDQVTLH